MIISPVGPWIDGVYWTLPIEIAFYCVIGVICVGRSPRMAGLTRDALVIASGGFWMAYAAFEFLPKSSPARTLMEALPFNHRLDLLLLHHGIYFATGMSLYRPPNKFRKLFTFPIILASAWAEINFSVKASALTLHVYTNPTVPYVIWISAIILLALSLRWNDFLHRNLNSRATGIVKYLGSMTYPLYLMHVVLAFGTIYVATRLGSSTLEAWISGIAIALIISAAVATYIEPSFRQLCDRLINFGLARLASMRLSKTLPVS